MKKQLLFLSMMLLAGSSFAQQVGVDQARQRALSFLKSERVRKVQSQNGQVSETSLELAYTSKRATDKKVCYYVFNQADNGGFIIVGGDQSAKEILGYSSNGSFDMATAPDNFKWWLSQYEEQISRAIDNPDVVKSTRNKAARKANGNVRSTIAPMMTTKWNQSAPFNNAVNAAFQNISGTNAGFVTGCVATAMSQVMKYHKYPTKGTGSANGTTKGYNLGGTTYNFTPSANFGATTYDWDNMIDSYNNTYSEAQANAVATLLYHCGVAVDMKYGQSGSSASSSDLPEALSTYFGYDKSAQRVERIYYTDDEWTDMIYAELAANRPVLYGGQDAYGGGGHEFVCHGYNSADNTFAINWGWGGMHDGYFTLIGVDGLQPDGSGIGGAGDGASYTTSQDIIINVMPDKGGSYPLAIFCNTNNRTPNLKDQNGNVTNAATVDLSSGTAQTLSYTFYPWNLSNDSRNIQTAVMLKDVVTGVCTYTDNKSSFRSLSRTYLYEQTISIKSSDFCYNGTYEVYPVVREKESDPWQRILVDRSITVPTITIVGGQTQTMSDVTFEISGNTVPVRGKLQITHDKFYNGNITYTASPAGIVSIDNNGEVTALSEGTATITVSGEETAYFNATTAKFTVTVTPYVKQNVEFSISDNNVLVGETLTISHVASDYAGNITYQSSDNTIATVSTDGVITGVSKGKVTITATAEEDELYNRTVAQYEVSVTEPGFIMTDYSIANNGYMTPSTVSITGTFKNQSGYNYSQYPIYCKFEIAGFAGTSSVTYQSWNNKVSNTITFSPQSWKSYFEQRIGRTGTMTFLDANQNPISDPISFTLCNELTVNYTMTAAGWGTICLPFEAEIPEGLTAYNVTNLIGQKLILEEAEKLEMNTPYLLSGTEGTYTFTGPDTPTGSNHISGYLVGNTAPSAEGAYVYAPKNSYVLQKQAEDGLGFYKVAADNSQKIRQYSAYLDSPVFNSRSCFSIDNHATGIEDAQEDNAVDTPAYNLQGIRVNGNAKGFVIVNGKLIYKK